MESRSLKLLEFPKVLDALASFAVSEPGASACARLLPAETPDEAVRLNQLLAQGLLWVRESGFRLASFPDLNPLFDFIERPAAVLDLDALAALKSVLALYHSAREAMSPYGDKGCAEFVEQLCSAQWPVKTWSGLGRCLDQDGRIKDESSPGLLEVRQGIRSIHQKCTRRVKEFILGENLSHYLQDEFMTISSDRYVLPLKANFKGRIKGIIHDYSQTGETCYFEPMFLVDQNNRLQELKREERREERKILEFLTGLVREEADGAADAFKALVELDVYQAKTRLADRITGRPLEISSADAPDLRSARHPLLAMGHADVHPVDIRGGEGQRALIISGGNAGGKTVCLKTLGLAALMGLSGLPVSAGEGSSCPFFQDVFVVMGDEQSLEENVSTFSAQIRYLSRAWDRIGRDSLFILDEFGAGTDPTQGAALAQATLEGLMDRGVFVCSATHFPALKAYALASPRVRAASVLFDPATKRPLFRLAYDQVGASIALDVAREHGLPEEIVQHAEKLLLLDGADTTAVLDRLNALAVDREKELTRLERERAAMADKRSRLDERFERERLQVLRDVQARARQVVDDWKQDRIGQKKARKELAEVRRRLADDREPETVDSGIDFEALAPGTRVVYPAWNKSGTVMEKDGRKKLVKVDLDGVAMWLEPDKLESVGDGGGGARRPVPEAKAGDGLTLRIDLRGLRGDEAVSNLAAFLDKALLRGATQVEIIHGRGTGALRQGVHEFLREFPGIAGFDLADEEHGGDGMTLAELA